jgi:polysaccharide deacetylase family protein (PEP-CTERM system associated)
VNRFFLITIDVEDWFQVENLRPWNPASTWDGRELRVEANVHKLLDLFDSFKFPSLPASKLQAKDNPAPCAEHLEPSLLKNNPGNPVNPVGLPFASAPCTVHRVPSPELPESSLPQASSLRPQAVKKVRCTFFTLGWIAERLPNLVREVAARGHEVASHGSSHHICRPLPDAELRDELAGSRRLLEDITGAEVAGFRAPNFSVDDRVLALIREAGYRYDSSYNNFALHGRYGRISLNGDRMGIAHRLTDDFFELPISNLPLSYLSILGTIGNLVHFRHFPLGGGAYFRLMPLSMFTMGVRSILKKQGAYIFFMHPWEIDPDQPQVHSASINCRFRHYTNLKKTYQRLKDLIASFDNCSFVTCHEYLKLVT